MGVNADPWCIMLSKSSHNFGSIVYQPTESRGTMVLSNAENLPPPPPPSKPPRPPPPKKKKKITLSQTTNSRLFENGGVCRQFRI